MKKLITLVAPLVAGLACQAQINVFTGNNVGIGAGLTSASSNLSINNTGLPDYVMSIYPKDHLTNGLIINGSYGKDYINGIWSNLYFTSNKDYVAIKGLAYRNTAVTFGKAVGVLGRAANAQHGYNWGVVGQLSGSNNGAGVCGQVGTGWIATDGMYAGYFYGNVKITGRLWVSGGEVTSSDKKLKKDIAKIDSAEKLFNLKPMKYKLKTTNELLDEAVLARGVLTREDSSVVSTAMADASELKEARRTHYGFVAQDVQAVYPDLVHTSGDGTLGIDYTGFIPIIVDQMQKMKAQMDAKDARIKALEDRLAALEKGKASKK